MSDKPELEEPSGDEVFFGKLYNTDPSEWKWDGPEIKESIERLRANRERFRFQDAAKKKKKAEKKAEKEIKERNKMRIDTSELKK